MSGIDSGRYALGILAAVAGIGFGIITLIELLGAGPNALAGRAKAAQEIPSGCGYTPTSTYVAPNSYG